MRRENTQQHIYVRKRRRGELVRVGSEHGHPSGYAAVDRDGWGSPFKSLSGEIHYPRRFITILGNPGRDGGGKIRQTCWMYNQETEPEVYGEMDGIHGCTFWEWMTIVDQGFPISATSWMYVSRWLTSPVQGSQFAVPRWSSISIARNFHFARLYSISGCQSWVWINWTQLSWILPLARPEVQNRFGRIRSRIVHLENSTVLFSFFFC